MSATCVIGLQWGDEAKGKIVDLLTERHDIVVRYQGGANAGHTVVRDGQTFKLSLVPQRHLPAPSAVRDRRRRRLESGQPARGNRWPLGPRREGRQESDAQRSGPT